MHHIESTVHQLPKWYVSHIQGYMYLRKKSPLSIYVSMIIILLKHKTCFVLYIRIPGIIDCTYNCNCFFIESIVSFRPVKEDLVDTMAIVGVTFGILAIVIIIFLLMYFGWKQRKIFCNKHFQKGNI